MSFDIQDPAYFMGIFIFLTLGFILRARLSRGMRAQQKNSNLESYGLVNRRDLRRYLKSQSVPLDEEPMDDEDSLFFEYEGEKWCAYKVLDVKRDVSEEELDRVYHQACKIVDEGSQAFVKKAFEAIKNRTY